MARTIIICAALCALAAPAAAADAREVQALMLEAHDQMVAAGRLKAQAKADEAAALYGKAVTAYAQVLEALPTLAGVAKETIVETRRIALYNTACAEAGRGEADAALNAFRKALNAGYDDFERIETDADLDPIRAEPRFAQLLERVKARILEDARDAAGPNLPDAALFPYDLETELTTIAGTTLKLSDHVGKVIVIDYWGTWCPPCQKEIPHFVKLQEEFGDKLMMVGLAWERGDNGDRAVARIKRFAEKHKINYPVVLLPDEKLTAKVPAFEGYPTTLFIDKQGRVRAKEVGGTSFARIHELLHALDDEPAPEPEKPAEPDKGDRKPKRMGPF
jgi:thiol-disulfide isomerase/thioredoxin